MPNISPEKKTYWLVSSIEEISTALGENMLGIIGRRDYNYNYATAGQTENDFNVCVLMF